VSSIHASCVSIDGRGVLIRGASGSGKSRLAHLMILRAPLYRRAATLVADDRVLVETRGGTLIARCPDSLAGLLEVRGLGIVRAPFLPEIGLALVLDLLPAEQVPRLPDTAESRVEIGGISLPRLKAPSPEAGLDALLTLLGQAELTLDSHSPLAPAIQDGKTTRP